MFGGKCMTLIDGMLESVLKYLSIKDYATQSRGVSDIWACKYHCGPTEVAGMRVSGVTYPHHQWRYAPIRKFKVVFLGDGRHFELFFASSGQRIKRFI